MCGKGNKTAGFLPLFSLEQEKFAKDGYTSLFQHCGYGLPELFRNDFRQQSLVAIPHPFASATLLALGPLLKYARLEPSSTTVEATSLLKNAPSPLGVLHESIYKLSGLKDTLQFVSSESDNPNLITKVTVTPASPLSVYELHSYYLRYYQKEAFVQLLPLGERLNTAIECGHFCILALEEKRETGQLIITSLLDPYGKGSVSQAVQNLNILFKLEETLGLLP